MKYGPLPPHAQHFDQFGLLLLDVVLCQFHCRVPFLS